MLASLLRIFRCLLCLEQDELQEPEPCHTPFLRREAAAIPSSPYLPGSRSRAGTIPSYSSSQSSRDSIFATPGNSRGGVLDLGKQNVSPKPPFKLSAPPKSKPDPRVTITTTSSDVVGKSSTVAKSGKDELGAAEKIVLRDTVTIPKVSSPYWSSKEAPKPYSFSDSVKMVSGVQKQFVPPDFVKSRSESSSSESLKSLQDSQVRFEHGKMKNDLLTKLAGKKLMDKCDNAENTGTVHHSPQKKINLPVYKIPENLMELIKKDVVPEVLTSPLSASNYTTFFDCLLYAEDYYLEIWSKYLLLGVKLQLRDKSEVFSKGKDEKSHKRSATFNKGKNDNRIRNSKNEKQAVIFDIDSVPENRPYLLSRDFVFLEPSDRKDESFQGFVICVQKGKNLVTEFGDNFYSQHSPAKKYNVNFSFNRVCLKRAHNAVSAAIGPFLCTHFLFPEVCNLPRSIFSALTYINNSKSSIINHILSLRAPPPYLIQALESVATDIIHGAILEIYRTVEDCRILVCAERNKTVDKLSSNILKEVPKHRLFRANAAFRDFEDVKTDVLQSCTYGEKEECFVCPPLQTLLGFKVITSTFMSSFRLWNASIAAGHFTHIFLVNASSVTEPEAVVPLAHLAGEKTAVVMSGIAEYRPRYIRSPMAWNNGLAVSYFERLLKRKPYSDGNPLFVCHIDGRSSSFFEHDSDKDSY